MGIDYSGYTTNWRWSINISGISPTHGTGASVTWLAVLGEVANVIFWNSDNQNGYIICEVKGI